jgi:NitT/TauT family transport system ATP-binding protein
MLIECRNLTHAYLDEAQARRVTALSNLSLCIAAGEFVCVLGPSGCGKTTLLHLLAGFLLPTGGEVRCNGRPVRGPGPERAVVFQEPTLYPWLTAQGNIEFGLRAQGLSAPMAETRAQEYLALVGLDEFAHSRPYELSGGMKQRVALARALALQPSLLLMDEPFSALDTQTREELQEELLRIWAQQQTTIVFVTHNVEEAVYLGQRILVLTPRPARLRADVALNFQKSSDRYEGRLCSAKKAILAELMSEDGALGRTYSLATCHADDVGEGGLCLCHTEEVVPVHVPVSEESV